MNYQETGVPTWTPSPAPSWTAQRLQDAVTGIDGMIIDLYKTMVHTQYKEPIKNLQSDILRLDGVVNDEQFLRTCLTTRYHDTDRYLEEVATRFGFPLNRELRDGFRRLVERERSAVFVATDVRPNLVRLASKVDLALGTNSWPFPVTKFLAETDMFHLFKCLAISAELGIAKQDGPEFFRVASLMLEARPQRVCTIDDNPELAILPALAAGNKVILCDRYFDYVDERGTWIDERLAAKYPQLPELELAVIRDFNQIPDPTR
jgi:FMN phosphatase YigB (HAD superfamily)